jgi:hypothetical protein
VIIGKETSVARQDNIFNHCLFWENDKLEDFKTNLSNRIEAIFWHGPRSVPGIR